MSVRKQPQPQHVLIVEDNDAIRRALEVLLKQMGHPVTVAASVAEALQRLGGQHVALLDLMLPAGPGPQIPAEIRRRGLPMRVAVMSPPPSAAEILRACPPDRFFPKPFALDALLAWIAAPPAKKPTPQPDRK